MDENLKLIVKDYLIKTEEAKIIMLEAFALKTKKDLISLRNRIPSATFFYAGMKHTFAFHGIGFRFSNEYAEGVNIEKVNRKPIRVDMELGHDDIWCGIDAWKLYYFIEEYYPEFKPQFTQAKIVEEFDTGIKEKTIYKKFNLYYFY